MKTFLVTLACLLALSAHAATFPVTNNLDSGAGSLRQALLDATAAPGPDVITFAPSLAGQTISLLSTISIFNAGEVTLDASAAPGLVIDDGLAEEGSLNSSSPVAPFRFEVSRGKASESVHKTH